MKLELTLCLYLYLSHVYVCVVSFKFVFCRRAAILNSSDVVKHVRCVCNIIMRSGGNFKVIKTSFSHRSVDCERLDGRAETMRLELSQMLSQELSPE